MTDTTAAAGAAADTTAAQGAAATASAATTTATTTTASTAGASASTTESTAAAAATLATAAPTDKQVADAPDWRKAIAGDDAEQYKRLERFASPAELYKSYRNLEQKFSGGEQPQQQQAQALPENATPEQLAEYRKVAGIPAEAKDYKIEFANGFQPPEADKGLLDFYRQMAHQNNWTPEQLNGVLAVNYQARHAQMEMQQERDQADRINGEESLRREYGNDYLRNMNAWQHFAKGQMPQGLFELISSARTMDGKLLGNHPEFVKWGVQTAIDFNPAATVLPAGVGNGPKGVSDEIAAIEATMKTEEGHKKYWGADPTMRNRYGALLEAREKMGNRAA